MQLLKIESIVEIKTSDNKSLSLIKGYPQNIFNIGVQPSIVTVVTKHNIINKSGDIIDINSSTTRPLWEIKEATISDPWEIYGSSHNSGMLWYGKNEDINNIEKKLEKEFELLINTKTNADIIEDEYDPFGSSTFVRWNFNDDTSLIIFYVVENSAQFNGNNFFDIFAPNVVAYCFGYVADERLCHEIIQYFPAKLLNQIKILDLELDEDYIEQCKEYSESVLINNELPKSQKDNELILSLSYHLFCSIMNWHADDYEEDENYSYIAKKLEKYNFKNQQ